MNVLQGLRQRQEWIFFAALPKADSLLAVTWWAVVILRGILPALFAIAMGLLVAAVQRGDSLVNPLAIVGIVFVLLQVLTPIQTAVSHNLGDRTAAYLYDRLTSGCVRPPGMQRSAGRPRAHRREWTRAASRLSPVSVVQAVPGVPARVLARDALRAAPAPRRAST